MCTAVHTLVLRWPHYADRWIYSRPYQKKIPAVETGEGVAGAGVAVEAVVSAGEAGEALVDAGVVGEGILGAGVAVVDAG